MAPAEALFGRAAEAAAVDRRLAAARAGQGSVLVVWGDPGIGKTTLLTDVARRATEFRVLSCRGVRSESGLAFAALHELLWPVLDRLDRLTGPQADALRGALGLGDRPTDPFFVGVAVLTLLSELAEEQPLLILVDDTQWLDPASVDVLAFVARRLATEPILLLATAHDLPGTRTDTLHLTGLGDSDARAVVQRYRPDLTGAQQELVLATAAGNPLALRELPDSIDQDTAEPAAVGRRLRDAFFIKVAELPPPVRTALLLAAAEEGATLDIVRQAGTALGLSDAAWSAAASSGLLIRDGDRIRLRHPLIRAVVYESAGAGPRREAHRALAAAVTDEDRRTWHLAAAADAPDEVVAGRLMEMAGRVWLHGGRRAASRALLRAAELADDPVPAARRLLVAARAEWEGGNPGYSRKLLARAESLTDRAALVDYAGGLEGLMLLGDGDPEQARRIFLRDAEIARADVASELRYLSHVAAWSAGSEAPDTDPDLLLDAALADGEDFNAWWRLPPGPLAVASGRTGAARALYERVVARSRTRGNVRGFAGALSQLAIMKLVLGEWDDGAADLTQVLDIAGDEMENSVAQVRTAQAWLAAARGEEEVAVAMAEEGLRLARPRRLTALTATLYWVLGLNDLAQDRTAEAADRLAGLIADGHEARHRTVAVVAALDAVEAAVRSGRVDQARAHAAVLTEWAERTGAAWAVAVAACCRALLDDGGAAETFFVAALEVPEARQRPFVYARMRLLYGEWLRRARRRADARIQLTSARVEFERLGAAPWVARTDRELELTGEQRARPAHTGSGDPLTPQELRIARLAATGMTNKEIAAQLYISPRTVGHHLSHLFPKLGVNSREELADMEFEPGIRLTG